VTETTLEEARRCPKCEQPGDLTVVTPAPARRGGRRTAIQPGTTFHHFTCRNKRCKWYDTVCRVVQVNPDGSIPPPLMKRAKEFPAIPDRTVEVNEALARQLAMETSDTGGEIARPR
jgi:hypothetical protein